ncbi:MAG TPA: hypothetical protein VMF58_14120 [Rhizomicrobium sp.]|nr:hypothetical protein [Rhizomicrobium sp.]
MDGRGAELRDESAISTLKQALTAGAGAIDDIRAWSSVIGKQAAVAEIPLTPLEHVVAAYLYRNRLFTGISGETERELAAALSKSWHYLTQERVEDRKLGNRLPRSVLRRSSRETRLFHAASFLPREAGAPWLRQSFGRDFLLEPGELVFLGAVLATAAAMALFTAWGAALLCCALLGYAVATIVEYSMHRWAGHEGNRAHEALGRFGKIGRALSEILTATYMGHFVFHHIKTSNRNYTSQFSPDDPKDREVVDAELAHMGATGRFIKSTNYGMTLNPNSVLTGFLTPLPVQAGLIWLLHLNLFDAVALMAPAWLYIAASRNLHPYLHKTRGEIARTAGVCMRFVARTRYAEYISRAHWIHHKGGGGNYNLVPGGDLLFGDFRKPNLDMVFRMRADGILGAEWPPTMPYRTTRWNVLTDRPPATAPL